MTSKQREIFYLLANPAEMPQKPAMQARSGLGAQNLGPLPRWRGHKLSQLLTLRVHSGKKRDAEAVGM